MQAIVRKTLAFHHFLAANLFYPLALASALSVGFLVARIWWSGSYLFTFLAWNLFLAWLPYLFGLGASALFHRDRRNWLLILLFSGLWLLFLPNAPYLLTDLLHLQKHPRVPLWYDVGMLSSAAITGVFLGFASLRAMQEVIAKIAGHIAGWLFACGVIALSSFGVYVGRELRWNSWDVFTNPLRLLRDVLTPIRHPIQNREAVGFWLMFAAILFVFYLTFNTLHIGRRDVSR